MPFDSKQPKTVLGTRKSKRWSWKLENSELSWRLRIRRRKNRIKKRLQRKRKRRKKPICAAYIRGDCQFGWKGRQCQYDHPSACVHHERTGYQCEGCDRHHPEDCHSLKQYKLCFKPNCLKNHRKWKDFKPEHLPWVPQEGGWDGKNWRTPSMKLHKEWGERDKGVGNG